MDPELVNEVGIGEDDDDCMGDKDDVSLDRVREALVQRITPTQPNLTQPNPAHVSRQNLHPFFISTNFIHFYLRASHSIYYFYPNTYFPDYIHSLNHHCFHCHPHKSHPTHLSSFNTAIYLTSSISYHYT